MAIQPTDIKLMASERLTDYYDGGGEMTGQEIIDGQVNNLFPDISRLDRTYGRVSLRKAFAAVMTANTDMYYGSHAIITQPPEDDSVHTTLFTTHDFYDIRQDAKDRIESYVTISHEMMLKPMNDQLEGQRAVNCFQPVGTELPSVGNTIVLSDTDAGVQQYLRITDISSETKKFNMPEYGEFRVDVVQIGVSSPLSHTFSGMAPTPYSTQTAATRIHSTVVANASKYYGVSKLTDAISQGDMSLWINSIYNQLVPTSQVETPITDQLMAGEQVTMVPTGPAGSATWSRHDNSHGGTFYMQHGIMPGSFNITIDGIPFEDDGQGNLLPKDDNDGGITGHIQYDIGSIILERSQDLDQMSATYTPATQVIQSPVTREIYIELANRAFNYTPNLSGPLPQPGTISVSYMAQGQWYQLKDNGRGELVGTEQNVGTGTIDYSTGSAVITVGALPDVDSSIIIQWGHALDVHDRSGVVDGQAMEIRRNLPHEGIDPGSLSISWDDGGAKTADDAGDGTFTGDASGFISYSKGEVVFVPSSIPASGTTYTITYQQETPSGPESITSFSTSGKDVTLTVPNAPLRPHSVHLVWEVQQIQSVSPGDVHTYETVTKEAWDDGNGAIMGDTTGTIDYSTGSVTMQAVVDYDYPEYYYQRGTDVAGRIYSYLCHDTKTATQQMPSTIEVRYAQDVAASLTGQTDTVAAPPVTLNVAPQTLDQLVAGSLLFSMDGSIYYDHDGSIYRDRDVESGSGTLSGAINYSTGQVTLDSHPDISDSTVTVSHLLSRDRAVALPEYIFRTPGAPVRDGSLSLRGTTPDGTQVSAIASTDGTISDTLIKGDIDTEHGVIRVRFGEHTTAAGNEDETWYNADAVQKDGTIWKPVGVLPETALYNCVVYSYLPLDASIIGIEPIRLPLDGRVPIFKSGDVAVIHHTQDELLPDNLSAGQSITLARDRLALVELRDQEGTLVDEVYYTRDLAAGTITMADPLDLSGYVQPLIAAHRIEDMVLISEAQINGLLRTVGPITHDFPADETQVSSALIFGDLAARIVRSFTQKTWDGVWRDTRSGDDTSAKYDDLHYPVEVTNEGSIAQRWCIKFTSSTTFDVISEQMGVIASGNTGSDIAPTNPATEVPYFTINHRGWGTGWSTGNCLRFDTSAANAPLWLARTTMQGPEEVPTDDFVLQIRGDAN